MLNRTVAPESRLDFTINYPKVQSLTLGKNARLHFLNRGTQEIIRLQLFFDAGTAYQSKALIAAITNSLLIEGSRNYSSVEIAELFDEQGAFLDTECFADKAGISLYCLSKSLPKLLPILKEVLFTATFPESEFNKVVERRREKFTVNNKKVAFQAKNHFLTFLFGEENPYATTINEDSFANIQCADIFDFYQKHYLNGKFELFAAGKVDEEVIRLISDCFGDLDFSTSINQDVIRQSNSSFNQQELIIQQSDAIQSAVRIGTPIVGKGHPDFPALFVTNTLLGGYFGSRLMSNIREDKGYTYGIGSNIVSHQKAAYFFIATEVGAEVTAPTLQEIELELSNLRSNFVDEEELRLVKNFINGSIVRSFDGAFAAMDRFISIWTLGLDYTYYDNLLEEIETIKAQRIKEVSELYLNFNKMKKVIVGKFNKVGN